MSIVRKLIAGPNNTLEGVCDCAPHAIPYTCLEDLVEPLTKIQKGEWHVASYARVTSVTRHARTSYNCVAISVKASCNRFIAEDEVQTTLEIEKLWQPVADIIGPIVQYATDGDKRRGAAYRSLTDRVLNVPGFRFLQIRVLHGEATVTKDLRHILKRFVRRLFSANPISIYGIAIDTNVLLLL